MRVCDRIVNDIGGHDWIERVHEFLLWNKLGMNRIFDVASASPPLRKNIRYGAVGVLNPDELSPPAGRA